MRQRTVTCGVSKRVCVAWIFYNKRYLCISYGVKEQKKKLEVKPKERKKKCVDQKGRTVNPRNI